MSSKIIGPDGDFFAKMVCMSHARYHKFGMAWSELRASGTSRSSFVRVGGRIFFFGIDTHILANYAHKGFIYSGLNLLLWDLQAVDAVLAVKSTNDRGDVKYPVKVWLHACRLLQIWFMKLYCILSAPISARLIVFRQWRRNTSSACERRAFIRARQSRVYLDLQRFCEEASSCRTKKAQSCS